MHALGLARHDERTSYIAILDKTFAVLDAQMVSHLQCRGTARIRDRDHDIDVMIWKVADDLAGELFAHTQTCLVDRQIVENRIRPREVDILENAGRVPRFARVVARIQDTVILDIDALTGLEVTHSVKLQGIERDAFRGDHVVS